MTVVTFPVLDEDTDPPVLERESRASIEPTTVAVKLMGVPTTARNRLDESWILNREGSSTVRFVNPNVEASDCKVALMV